MLKISDELINEFSVVSLLHQPMALSKTIDEIRQTTGQGRQRRFFEIRCIYRHSYK
jgi:hypothetical protein